MARFRDNLEGRVDGRHRFALRERRSIMLKFLHSRAGRMVGALLLSVQLVH